MKRLCQHTTVRNRKMDRLAIHICKTAFEIQVCIFRRIRNGYPCPMSQEVNMKIHYHGNVGVAENFHFQFFWVVVDANLLFSFPFVNIYLGIQSTELQTKLLLLLKYGALTSNGIPNRCSFVFF